MLRRCGFLGYREEVHYVARFRDKLKILLWQRNGSRLWYRRLERERFRWLQSEAAAIEVSARELRWLLDGLDISQVKGHRKADFGLL
jgi:transposase